MFQNFLGILAFFLAGTGTFFILKAFFAPIVVYSKEKNNHRKLVITGCIGAILLLCAGIIVIYFYSLQPVSDRIIKEKENRNNGQRELPDVSVSELNN